MKLSSLFRPFGGEHTPPSPLGKPLDITATRESSGSNKKRYSWREFLLLRRRDSGHTDVEATPSSHTAAPPTPEADSASLTVEVEDEDRVTGQVHVDDVENHNDGHEQEREDCAIPDCGRSDSTEPNSKILDSHTTDCQEHGLEDCHESDELAANGHISSEHDELEPPCDEACCAETENDKTQHDNSESVPSEAGKPDSRHGDKQVQVVDDKANGTDGDVSDSSSEYPVISINVPGPVNITITNDTSSGDEALSGFSDALKLLKQRQISLNVTSTFSDSTVSTRQEVAEHVGAESVAASITPPSSWNNASSLALKITRTPRRPNRIGLLSRSTFVEQDTPVLDVITKASYRNQGLGVGALQNMVAVTAESNPRIDPRMKAFHIYFKELAYQAADGDNDAWEQILRLVMFLHRGEKLSPNAVFNIQRDTGVEHCLVSEIDECSWRWIRRAYAHDKLSRFAVESKHISSNEAEYIINQLLPQPDDQLLSKENFKLLIDTHVEGVSDLEKSYGDILLSLQATAEEIEDPSASLRPTAPAFAPRPFDGLPIHRDGPSDTFASSRAKQLHEFLQAVVYCRTIWCKVNYDNALTEFNKYWEAFDLGRRNKSIPAALRTYVRDWHYDERRLLRAAKLLLDLRPRLEEMDYDLFNDIRGALIHADGQPLCGADDLSNILYHRVVASNLEIKEIPEIMVLHPIYDGSSRIKCEHDEVKAFDYWKAKADEFQAEEDVRLAEIETAEKAFRHFKRKKRLGVFKRSARMVLRMCIK